MPPSLRVFERMRFNRTHVTHQVSMLTRSIYAKNNWTPELVHEYTDFSAIPFYLWITRFDVFANVEEEFDHPAHDIRSGKPEALEELSLPAGGNYDAKNIDRRVGT